MGRADLARRIEIVERRMETWEARVAAAVESLESQISQLRDEMHEEFSAVRREIATGDEGCVRSLREEIRAGDEETRRVLREEIRAGDEERRHLMRVLHEEVLHRMAKLGEAS